MSSKVINPFHKYEDTVKTLGLSDANDGSGDSALEKFLSGDPNARLDMFAGEFNAALDLLPGAVGVAQFRVLLTAPKRLANGKHSMDLRIRVLDESGGGRGFLWQAVRFKSAAKDIKRALDQLP